MADGRNPRATALEITGRMNRATGRREGGILGLTSGQTDAVIRARAELLSGDPAQLRNYLTRTRRDARFDRMVLRAIKDGRPLAAADVDRITGRYKDRLLALRGEMISRTETLAALNAAKEEGIRQLIDRGKVQRSQVTKVWRATGDARTRDSHVALNGKEAGIDEAFVSPLTGARMMYPHDTSHGAPASEVIQCFAPWTKIAKIGLLRAIRHEYAGEFVELSFGGNVPLTVTPNHPVLTGRGWVAAGEIKKGDDLFQCGFGDVGGSSPGVDVDDVYALAQQLYDAGEALGAGVRAGRDVVNFHGHVPDQDVDVVAVPRSLRDAFEPTFTEKLENDVFADADVSQGRLLASRILGASGRTLTKGSRSEVGRGGAGQSGLRGHEAGTKPVAFAHIGPRDVEVCKAGIDQPTADAQFARDAEDGKAFGKKISNQRDDIRALLAEPIGGLGGSADLSGIWLEGKIGKTTQGDVIADPKRMSDFGNIETLGVQLGNARKQRSAPDSPMVNLARVSKVRRFHYEGPVYNFESRTNVLVSNGIVNHNCRCFYEIKIDFLAPFRGR